MSDVENGPLTEANRECRDIFCCLLFLAAIGGMGYLTYAAYYNNDPTTIFRGVNQNNLVCGNKLDLLTKDKPYLYFYDPRGTLSLKKACVAVCPYYDGTTITAVVAEPTVTYTDILNLDGTAILASTGSLPIVAGDVVGYDTYPLLGRICVPSAKLVTTIFDTAKLSAAFSQS